MLPIRLIIRSSSEAASIFVAYNLKRLLGKLTVPKIIEKFSQLS